MSLHTIPQEQINSLTLISMTSVPGGAMRNSSTLQTALCVHRQQKCTAGGARNSETSKQTELFPKQKITASGITSRHGLVSLRTHKLLEEFELAQVSNWMFGCHSVAICHTNRTVTHHSTSRIAGIKRTTQQAHKSKEILLFFSSKVSYLSDHLCSILLETNYNSRITFEIDFELICWQFALQRPVLLWEDLCFHTSSWNLPLLLTSSFKHFSYIQALANVPLLQVQVAAGWTQPGHLNWTSHCVNSWDGSSVLIHFWRGKPSLLVFSHEYYSSDFHLQMKFTQTAFTQITYWREKRFSFYENADCEWHGWFFFKI